MLNRDEGRERCQITELQGIKLRKVSFCVDVEVAPSCEDFEARKEARRKRREAREREKEKLKEIGSDNGLVDGSNGETPVVHVEAPVADISPAEQALKEKEEQNEKSGLNAPAELSQTDTTPCGSPMTNTSVESAAPTPPPASEVSVPDVRRNKRAHARPTTDPMKIYTQCCQLRETKLLPAVVEQLAKAKGAAVLQMLDMSNHAFALPDAVALSDFLALVPIKHVIFERCGLSDEMVRVMLCGLSAVRPLETVLRPRTTKMEKHASQNSANSNDENSHRGVVERLSLKNNPNISKEGWRYISCFIHMSHSLKAVDVSMIPLPRAPIAPHDKHHLHLPRNHSPSKFPTGENICSVLSKALGERLVGHGLEELIMGECSLSTEQLKCLLDGIAKGGTRRLCLEGNAITDDGFVLIGKWLKAATIESGSVYDYPALDISNNNLQVSNSVLLDRMLMYLGPHECPLRCTQRAFAAYGTTGSELQHQCHCAF